MRLRRLKLDHYGNFAALDLPLDPAPGVINLIEAPNGAGKSVLRQAFHDLLFGIDAKTPFLFPRFAGERPELTADAVLDDGEDVRFGTRQKEGFKLHGGSQGATVQLLGALKRVTPKQLENLFALDTAHLRAGGRELASGGDTLGLALLAGTGELTFAKSLRLRLAERRSAIWEAGKTSRPLHRANRALMDARSTLRDAVRQPKQRQAELAMLEAHRAELAGARATHAQASETARRLARIDRTRGALADLAAAREWLTAHSDAPLLPPELADRLAAAVAEANLAAATLGAAERQAAERHATAASLPRDPAAIAAEARLAGLAERLGEIEKSTGDSRRVSGQRDQLDAAVAATVRELGCPPDVDPASLLPAAATVGATRDLITQHAAVRAKLESSDERSQAAREAAAQLAAEALEEPPTTAVAALAPLLAAIRADGDPAHRLADAARTLRLAEAAAAVALAAVPGWCGDAAALAGLAPPADAAIERLAQAAAAAETAAATARSTRDRLSQDRAAWRGELEALQHAALPDVAAIARARAARDAGWQLIYQRAFTSAPDGAGEAAYAAGEPLPLRFERHLREADSLADRRLLELTQVTEAERLTRRLAAAEPEWDRVDATVTVAEAHAAAAQTAWAELCRASGAAPDGTVGELRSFLAARMEAVRTAAALAAVRAEHGALAAAQAAWAARLRPMLGAAEAELPGLLALAETQLAAAARAEGDRILQRTRRAEAQTRLQREAASQAAAVEAMAAWQRRWFALLTELGRPPEETPAATQAVLQSLETLRSHSQERRGLVQRLDDMRADGQLFAADVAALAAELELPPGEGVFAAARALIARRDRARQREAAWQEADKACLAAAQQLGDEAARARTAQDMLAALIAACGAADAEDAAHRLARSGERARHEAMRSHADAMLRDHGDGLPHEALRDDATAVPPEHMAAAREAAQAAMQEALARSETAAVTVNQVEQQLASAALSEEAIVAAGAQTAAAATQSRLLEDYLLLSVASDMLARALAEVEQSAGSTGLQRISDAFASLTCGAYSIVGAEVKGQTVLQAVEASFPREWKDIAQLSEGTRDQLYLALRFVAIKDFVAAGSKLPFIADDILQTFDDVRARATLAALAELSQQVQVIVLTHHPHVVTLAEGLPVRVLRL